MKRGNRNRIDFHGGNIRPKRTENNLLRFLHRVEQITFITKVLIQYWEYILYYFRDNLSIYRLEFKENKIKW